jgi:hypothetical protein
MNREKKVKKKKNLYLKPVIEVELFFNGHGWNVLTTSAYVNFDDDQYWDDREIIDDPFA